MKLPAMRARALGAALEALGQRFGVEFRDVWVQRLENPAPATYTYFDDTGTMFRVTATDCREEIERAESQLEHWQSTLALVTHPQGKGLHQAVLGVPKSRANPKVIKSLIKLEQATIRRYRMYLREIEASP